MLSLLHNSKDSWLDLCNRTHLYKRGPIPLLDAFGISSRSSNGIILCYSNSMLYSLMMPVDRYPWLNRFSISLLCNIYSFDYYNCPLVRVRLRSVCESCTQYFSKDSNIIGYILCRLDSWLDIFCRNIPFPCYILDKSCWYKWILWSRNLSWFLPAFCC